MVESTEGLEFDVCEDGGIVSSWGEDATAALEEAIRSRRGTDADVITVLVTRRPE